MSDTAVPAKKKVVSILIFANGNVAAFGPDGEQIAEIQRKTIVDLIVECAVEAGFDIDGCIVDLPGLNPMQFRIHMDDSELPDLNSFRAEDEQQMDCRPEQKVEDTKYHEKSKEVTP